MISSVHLTNHESGLVACPIAIEVVTRYCPGNCGVKSEALVFQYARRALKSNVNTTGRCQLPKLARTQRAYRGPTFDLYRGSLRVSGLQRFALIVVHGLATRQAFLPAPTCSSCLW
jgi:hypothetical protein